MKGAGSQNLSSRWWEHAINAGGGYLERRLCPFQPKSEQMMMKRIKMSYVAMSRWSLELEKIMRGLPEYLI